MSPILGNYQSIAAEKRLQRSGKIPKSWLIPTETSHDATNILQVPVTCGVLNDVECKITSDYDATVLLEKLKSGVWSVEQVIVAFCKRAAIAQQLVSHPKVILFDRHLLIMILRQTNCLTEIFFDEAIDRARQLDRERRQTPNKVLPPLYGLPISLKDSFHVLGHDTSTGLACYVNEPAKENSALAAMLLDLGAVLYCKTNLPQLIMTGDSDNNVFGRTLNPRNAALTAGGSTGGEGALIALRGSVLGVGTDIGGSIRVPSVCNGIYGFRPSVGLIPHGGVRDLTVPGTDGVRSTVGPMATSIRDCSLFIRSIMQADTWKYDSTVVSLPWRNLAIKRKLRIGLVEDVGVYTPSPPVRRGLREAADLLRRSNQVDIVPITLPNVKEYYEDLVRYFTLLGSDVRYMSPL